MRFIRNNKNFSVPFFPLPRPRSSFIVPSRCGKLSRRGSFLFVRSGSRAESLRSVQLSFSRNYITDADWFTVFPRPLRFAFSTSTSPSMHIRCISGAPHSIMSPARLAELSRMKLTSAIQLLSRRRGGGVTTDPTPPGQILFSFDTLRTSSSRRELLFELVSTG